MARRISSPVLVGRATESHVLDMAMAAAAAGQPRHVVIGGEAGVGKTRLLADFRARAERAGARVLVGGCVSVGDTGLPFAPFTEILRSLIAQDGAAQVAAVAGRAAGDLARLVPALSPDAPPPGQELWAQTRMYEALLDLLRHYAQRSPLVVVLEDLHWADAGTLAAASYLLRAIDAEAILVLATYREDEVVRTHPLRSWLAEASRIGRVERLSVAPLDEGEVVELVTTITGEKPTIDLVADLIRRSDGNPFFVEELLVCGQDAARALPTTIRDVLLSRVDAVAEPARELIGVAAVGGRDVDHAVLMDVAGEGSDAVAALRTLVDAGLLVPTSGPQGEGYSFRHALVQEAVHDALLPHDRRRLHQAFASALAREVEAGEGQGRAADTSRLVELAHHWREARDPRALAASVRAGDAAMAGFSFQIAADEYEHALALWESQPDGAVDSWDRVDLLSRAARATHMASRLRRAEALTRAAVAELGEEGDLERRTNLTVDLARILWVSGQYGASLDTYEEANRMAPPAPSVARVRALAGLGQDYMLFGRFTASVELCEQAAILARALERPDLVGHALNTLATSFAALGRGDEALANIDEALRIAEELNLPDDIGRAHVNRGDILDYAGRPAEALGSTRRGIETMSTLGMEASYGVYLRHNGVQFAFESGSWRDAAELQAEADRRAPDEPGIRFYRAEYVLSFLVASGADDAGPTWAEARRMLLDAPPSAAAAVPYAAAVELAAQEGRFEAAAALIEEAIAYVGQADATRYLADFARVAAWPVAELGLLARRAGDGDGHRASSARFERLLGLVDEARLAVHDAGGPLGALLRWNREQVLAERARMEGAATAQTWRDVTEGWGTLGFPYRALYARWRHAEVAASLDDRAAATETLRAAHEDASRLGARPLAAQMEGLARKLRLRLGAAASPSQASPEPPDAASAAGLTPREREVLTLVAAGRTNRQVAEHLFISESTAGVHVSNILGKLGVATRTEAAREAINRGLVET